MYDRIIDLGCGQALAYPRLFPAANAYVGIDISRPNWADAPPSHSMSFVQGDAIESVPALSPGADDLVTMIFSAHHIGWQRVAMLVSAIPSDVFVVEPLLHHPHSPGRYFLGAATRSFLATVGLLGGSRRQRRFCRNQLKFLLQDGAFEHTRDDLEAGRLDRPEEVSALEECRLGSTVFAVRGTGFGTGLHERSWFYVKPGSIAAAIRAFSDACRLCLPPLRR